MLSLATVHYSRNHAITIHKSCEKFPTIFGPLSLGEVKKMDMIKVLARKLRAVIGNDDHGFYVAGSGPVWVPNVRAHEIPKVIAEHHRDQAKRELQRILIMRR